VIIDSFIFFDEYDLLEGRLEYLAEHVDYFIIVEADTTHSGKKKPFNLPQHWDRFGKYLNKIIYIPYVVDLSKFDATKASFPADLANAQRDQIATVLHVAPDDAYIMISDVDEIPDRTKFNQQFAKELVVGYKNILLGQILFYFNLKRAMTTIWHGPVLTTVGRFKEMGPSWFRINRFDFMCIHQGGWHLSYWGTPEQVQNKIFNFADQEFNKPEFTNIEHIKSTMASGGDLYGRDDMTFIDTPPGLLPQEFLDCFKKFEPK